MGVVKGAMVVLGVMVVEKVVGTSTLAPLVCLVPERKNRNICGGIWEVLCSGTN